MTPRGRDAPRAPARDGNTADRGSHEQRLARLADIAIQIGLCPAPGQEVVVTAPVEALPLVRLITGKAYEAGASLVTTLFTDETSTRLRFRYAGLESFDRTADWLYGGMAQALRNGSAWLLILGDDPALMVHQDAEKVARYNRATWQAFMTALRPIFSFDINWSFISYATRAWARAIFPGDPDDVAVRKLWDAIFAASHADAEDPIAAWRAHKAALAARAGFLNDARFAAVRFRGPGTDLHVGLADDHNWLGGRWIARNGVSFTPNIPTEEIATAPHKDRVEGIVRSTKPLCYQGTLIKGISMRFAGGRIVEADAEAGADLLQEILQTDEGARHIGEVALVPNSSPIARSGLLFRNTLFDENAASHIALGQAYSPCIIDGTALSPEELAAKGVNHSLLHIDWMIGSSMVDVDGLSVDGSTTPLMRAGEWV